MKPGNLVFDFIDNALTFSCTVNSKEKVDYIDRTKDLFSVFVRNIRFGVAYIQKIGFYKRFVFLFVYLFSLFLC